MTAKISKARVVTGRVVHDVPLRVERATHSLVFTRPQCGHVVLMMHDIVWPTKKERDEDARSIADAIRAGCTMQRLAFGSPELKATKLCDCKAVPR